MIELSKYLQDEQAAENYLYEKGILKNFTTCPHCGSDKLGNLSRSRIKCYKCKKEWNKRKGSFLEGKHVSYSKFIGVLKLFNEDYGFTEISRELILDRKTTQEILSEMLALLLDANNIQITNLEQPSILLLDKAKQIVLCSKENFQVSDNKSYIELSFDRYKGTGGLYSFMINAKFVGNQKDKLALNNFLGFSKMRLISFRGIKSEKLFQYLSETIIRFNLRESNFNDYLLKILSK